MANCITRYIPNTLTCLNLFSGCVAAVMAFQFKYDLALLFIIIGAVFDFFDGLAARALNAHSPIGKDLDSLADDICFGIPPSARTSTRWRTTSASGWRHPWWCSRCFGRCPIRSGCRAFLLISLIWLS